MLRLEEAVEENEEEEEEERTPSPRRATSYPIKLMTLRADSSFIKALAKTALSDLSALKASSLSIQRTLRKTGRSHSFRLTLALEPKKGRTLTFPRRRAGMTPPA